MTQSPLRVLSIVPSMARKTGGPAIAQVQATLAMDGEVKRTIYCSDAAQPAATTRFERLTPQDLARDADQIDVRVFLTRRPHAFAYSPALFRAIGKSITEFDLVTIHSLNLFPQLAAYTHAYRTGTPYIVTPHGALDPWLRKNSPRRKAINNLLWQNNMLRRASALHFTTQDEADLVKNIAPRVPRYIVPNGVRISDFQNLPDRRIFRDKFLAGFSGKVILFLSRIAKKKGIDLLLASFARAATTDDALLVIVGPDDEGLTPTLTQQAAELGISDRVRFLGPLYDEDHKAALASADIWSLTSHTENFGNAVLEAMAAGLPVIISTAVNIAPEVNAAGAGCVTSLNVGDISTQIDHLLTDSDYRQSLGQRAVSFASRYDWPRVASHLIEMYQAVVATSQRET
jgi:glycosyltransferase involved in cell wall biosynthesis